MYLLIEKIICDDNEEIEDYKLYKYKKEAIKEMKKRINNHFEYIHNITNYSKIEFDELIDINEIIYLKNDIIYYDNNCDINYVITIKKLKVKD